MKDIGGVFLPPTLEVDYQTVRKGQSLNIVGYAFPASLVSLFISRDIKFISDVYVAEVVAASDGRYAYRYATRDLDVGTYYIKSRAESNGETTPLSELAVFVVSLTQSEKKPGKCRLGDLNDDERVNIVDFSIAMYWYKKPLRLPFLEREASCLNQDGKVDMRDFSLMAYYWTG